MFFKHRYTDHIVQKLMPIRNTFISAFLSFYSKKPILTYFLLTIVGCGVFTEIFWVKLMGIIAILMIFGLLFLQVFKE